MLKVLYTRINGVLLADISSVLTLLPLDPATMALLAANINFAGGEWTYLKLDNGVYSEEVKVTDISGSYAVVTRGVSGSTPKAFAYLDTEVTDTVGIDAVQDTIAQTPVSVTFSLDADGLAYLTGTPTAPIVNVDPPNFTGDGVIEVLGSWPNIQFVMNLANSGCCPGESTAAGDGTGVNTLNITSDILQGSIVGQLLNLVLQTPVFTGAGSVAVTGTYPNYTIYGDPGSTGGSVISVGVGSGLTITGSPTVNPTISITNTGVTAGDYSGFVVNARGQITQIPVGFAPISSIAVADGAIVTRTGGDVTLTFGSADVGVRGLVALADETSPVDSADKSSAVSPALLAAALATTGGGSSANGSGTGEADGSYVTAISSTLIALTLAAGKTALIIGEIEVLDGTTPLTPVAYGVAVFDAASTKKVATKICTQSKQSILGIVTGPFSGNLNIVTTALPAGSTVQSAFLAALKL